MSEPNGQEAIAIIGMAGRFPKARNLAEFWCILREGVDAITFFDEDELDHSGFGRTHGNYVKARGLLEDADKFDAQFFGINPKEAEIIDPQQRVFLEAAWEALEDAGYDTQREERPIGVFAGMSMNTYMLSNLVSNPELVELVGGYHMMLANDKDFLPMRVSYKLNLRGPSLNVQTACSTSLVAVCLACQQLLSYQCDMALAGAVSITFPQKKGHIFQEGGIASTDGHCRAFDARAQGTVAGEGAGVVVLKRLSDAIADGDDIHAVIKGFALNNDGSLKAGYTAPSEDGQAECIALAQAIAGIDPETIEYVMTHGTGTPLGDPIEIAGLTKAFRAGTQAKGFCALTSVKTNIGHLDAAAGIAGLIGAVLALKHKQIPPSLYFEQPNPKIDFANSPFFVNTQLREWKRGKSPRRAGVSSFGIGGTNSHVVLEEWPEDKARPEAVEPRLLVLSAKTATALNRAGSQLADFLRQNSKRSLADIAFTLQVGRREFTHRLCLVARHREEAVEILDGAGGQRLLTGEAGEGNVPISFLFPGQGSQQVNMGRELYQKWKSFRQAVDECSDLLRPHLEEDLRALLYADGSAAEAARLKLQETRITQPALFVTSYAMARLWEHVGIKPETMIGHSIGEYVAACLAGVMSLSDTLRVVALRGRLMQQMKPGSMLAVRADETEVAPLLTRGVSVAAINGPMQCVLSGVTAAIDEMEHLFAERKIACQRLRTSHAFHSEMMEPMLREFGERLRQVKLRSPSTPFISNVSGTWITPAQATDPEYWVKHVRSGVRFAPGVAELLRERKRVFLECGPGQTLTGLVRQQAGAERTVIASLGRSAGTTEEYRVQLEAAGQLWLSGVSLKWQALDDGGSRRRVHLPAYPFERKRCWVEPGRICAQPQNQLPEASVAEKNGEIQIAASNATSKPANAMEQLRELFAKLSGIRGDQLNAEANFTEMGLESLFLTHASQAIEKTFGVQVPFGDLIEKYSTLNRLAAHLESVAVRVVEKPAVNNRPAREGAVSPASTFVPLTEAQREIWFETQRSETASCVFNETCRIELKGELNKAALERAISEVVGRHEALRATMLPDGSAQKISATSEVLVTDSNVSRLAPAQRERALEELLRVEGSTPFDLVNGPLIRFSIVGLDDKHHALIFTGHHLVCDGGSISLIIQEISEFYNAHARGMKAQADPAYTFREFAAREEKELEGGERRKAEDYWLNEFATPATELELPQDSPRPSSQTFRAGQARWRIDRDLTQRLKRLSGQRGATLFTMLLAAYYTLLHRLSGQEDLVVGVPASGRGTSFSGRLVGHCVNFLPMRVRTRSALPFEEHLKRVTRKFVEAYEHQGYTFGTLVQRLSAPRVPNRMPLISATFNLQKEDTPVGFEGLQAEIRTNYRVFTNVDLTFDVLDINEELEIECTYCADLFRPETIERWLRHYETLLRSIATDSERVLSQLQLLTPAEWQQMVREWNQTVMKFPREACLHELFEAQVERTPEAVAAIVGQQEITYRELNRRANQVADYLNSLGARPEALVGLCVERSFALLVGVLGILKSGAAYVPLDWTYPPEHVRFMLEDTRAAILVTQQDLLQHIPATNARVVCLDGDWEQIAEHDTGNPARVGDSGNLAYVMYTSGSTGMAKGVGVEHRSAVSFVHWAGETFPPEELTGVLASTSICFDLSIFELFVPLSWGGTVILADNAVDLPSLPHDRSISLINTVPSAIKDLLKAGRIPSSVLVANLAGEKLSTQVVQQLYALPNIRKVYDLYGPSEATTYATFALRAANGLATIGRPIANTQIYILDAEMQPCPVGVAGEIHIGGDGLARGYINRPELTAEKFVPNPFSETPGARLYKTGDLARYWPDGNIEFIGRSDHQVKMRGYRIELGEIETVLAQHPGVHECIAVVREDAPEQKELVAYVVAGSEGQLNTAELRRFLRERLPDYMVPSVFMTLPALPLMRNGKVDRDALPAPVPALSLAGIEAKPEACTPVEEALTQIWREVLSVEKVGLHDDFFDLGGHSILVTQIISRVRQVFEVDLSMRHLFGAPTVAALARILEQLVEEQLQQMSEQELQQLVVNGKGGA
jgi:amino acid adenylation domain-containing protein